MCRRAPRLIPKKVRERLREKEIAKRRLSALVAESREVGVALKKTVKEFNGVRGDARSFDRLEELLAEQAYLLCFWRVAADEINYRRFFDINELAAIRVEEPEVFTSVHELVFRLVKEGHVTGLRIDHIDGLHDPEQYLRHLQGGCRKALRRLVSAASAASDRGSRIEDRGSRIEDRGVSSILDPRSSIGAAILNRTTLLCRGRKDLGARRAIARKLGGARDDRVRFSEPAQRPLR